MEGQGSKGNRESGNGNNSSNNSGRSRKNDNPSNSQEGASGGVTTGTGAVANSKKQSNYAGQNTNNSQAPSANAAVSNGVNSNLCQNQPQVQSPVLGMIGLSPRASPADLDQAVGIAYGDVEMDDEPQASSSGMRGLALHHGMANMEVNNLASPLHALQQLQQLEHHLQVGMTTICL